MTCFVDNLVFMTGQNVSVFMKWGQINLPGILLED